MKFAVGQIVICHRTNEAKYSYLVGAVGEVVEILPSFLATIMGSDYAVVFPALCGMICPNCQKSHKGLFAMSENELKPLDDPDAGEDTEHDKELPTEFGFVAIN